jgi:glycerophosphoryl diester phosphodiesterase
MPRERRSKYANDAVDNAQLASSLAQKTTDINDLFSMRNITVKQTRIIGHRGGSGYAPENTLASVEKAAELGYFGSECDVKLTSDGELVLMHDDTVDRTTNGTGNVASLTLAQIKALTIDAGNNIAYYPNLKVPTLAEQLAHCKKYGLACVCHTYITGHSDKFLEVVRKYDMESSTIVLSSVDFCNELRQKSNKLTLFVLSFELLSQALIDQAKQNKFGLSFGAEYFTNLTDIQANVEYAHEQGVILNTWTENNYARLNTLKEYGVQFVTTDLLKEEKPSIETLQQTQNTRFIASKNDYLNVMSLDLKTEHAQIPASNGYYFEPATNAIHVYSDNTKQGFIYFKTIGKVKKGDYIEIFMDVDIKSGTFKTGYDTTGKYGNETITHPLGRQKVYRKFIVPFDADTFTPFIGTGTTEVAQYTVYDGITIKVSSNRNAITSNKTILKAMLVTDDGTKPERFTYYAGDECTITKQTDYYIFVTFAQSLNQRGIALVTGDVGGDKYIPKTGYSYDNRFMIKFIDSTTGQQALLSSLPSGFYINIALL